MHSLIDMKTQTRIGLAIGLAMALLAVLSPRAEATNYTWKTASGNWNTAANWNPSGIPGAGDVCAIASNSPCVANTNLTGNPQVGVYTNGALDVAADLSSQTIVLDNGGALRKDGGTSPTRTVSDPIKIQGAGYFVGRSRQVDFNLNGLIQDGASSGKLVVQWQADTYWQNAIYLRYTNNTYSGGTEVQAGRLTWPSGSMQWADKFYAAAPGSLGTGGVLVRSNAWLNLGATNTTGPGAVITVENGGKVEIGTNTAGHTILLKDGAKVCKDWASYAPRTSTDTIQIEGTGYAVAVMNQTSLSLNGMIQDGATPGRLVLDTEPAANNWGTDLYLNGTNTCTGGTEVRPSRAIPGWTDWVYAGAAGCFCSGPLVVHPNGWLNLLVATAADWTLTNNISMGIKTAPQSNGDWTKANIKVQAGAHRLTAAGSVITAGAFTNAASLTTNTTGTLAINGKFAFARNNGNPATLAIGIAGTGNAAGLDHSQLSIGTGDSSLAASITNCDLVVTVAANLTTNLTPLSLPVTNVLAPGANFSGYQFRSVTWSSGWIGGLQYAWTGGVQYANGSIVLTGLVLRVENPQIQNRTPTGVATNAATFNAYLATSGSSPASVYVAWGQTNGAVSGAWGQTNWWNVGAWPNGSYPSATMGGLSPNANYYYTFGATNSTTQGVADGYQYLITGEVTVQATDPTGRSTLADTAAFTVYRPASCTNDALTVAYTLSGTAANGIQYTNWPAATGTNGTVTIPAGQSSAVIMVFPLNQINPPPQTVVLTLASGPYAIGAPNSATCTLVTIPAAIYTWKTADGNWSTAGNWNPSGPPGVISIGRIMNNSPCRADSNLVGPQIEVYTNCALDVYADLSSQTIVLDNGGALRKDAARTTRTVSDPIKIQGAGSMVGGAQEVNFNLNGLIQDGASAGKLVVQWQADGYWQNAIYLRYTNNTYSGGTEVQAGRMNWAAIGMSYADKFYALAPGSLGTGSVLVRSNAWLNLGATNTTGPGAVITVENGGKVEIGANTAGHTILLKDGGKVCKDWSSGTARISTDTIQIEGTGYAVAVMNQTSLSLNGMIQDGATPGRLVLDTEPAAQNWGVLLYLNGTNACTGGTEVRPTRHTQPSIGWADWVYAGAAGCFGSGPLVVHPYAWLNLLLPSAANWTLTNNISMGAKTSSSNATANIKVQAGAHRLTAAGSVITAGAFTNAASLTTHTTGTLAINGKFAFARTNETCATLAIGIAGTNGVAGVDYSQLSVSAGDTNLAASITNCDLSVTVVPKLVTDGMVVTNLVATGADFSSYKFRSVAWNPGWAGNVQYGNGFIVLTGIRSTEGGTVLMVY